MTLSTVDTAFAVQVEVILTLEKWCICPGQKVLEDGAWIVEVCSPAAPRADVAERPSLNHGEVLAAATAERVRPIWPRIDVDIQEVVPEALKERF